MCSVFQRERCIDMCWEYLQEDWGKKHIRILINNFQLGEWNHAVFYTQLKQGQALFSFLSSPLYAGANTSLWPVLPKPLHTTVQPHRFPRKCPFHTLEVVIHYRLCCPRGSTVHQPSQQHLPDCALMHMMGRNKTWATHTQWPVRSIQPQRCCGCSDWADTHPAMELVQNHISLKAAGQGKAGGTHWNGSRGLEVHFLVVKGTPFHSHYSPGLL